MAPSANDFPQKRTERSTPKLITCRRVPLSRSRLHKPCPSAMMSSGTSSSKIATENAPKAQARAISGLGMCCEITFVGFHLYRATKIPRNTWVNRGCDISRRENVCPIMPCDMRIFSPCETHCFAARSLAFSGLPEPAASAAPKSIATTVRIKTRAPRRRRRPSRTFP